MSDVLRGKGVPEEKLRIIENWADGDAIRPLPRSENPFIREHGLAGKFVVMYSGNMGLLHDLESIVGAAARLRERTEMRFVFIGGGGKLPAVRRLVDEHRLDNVLLLPYQPREALGYTLTAADVSLVSLAAGNEGLAVPSKLYGIMAAGSPVVANVPEACEVARVLAEAECGLVVPVGDPEALAGAIARYLDDPELRRRHGSNARTEFERRYALERVVDRWVEVLR
jgi:glycosyltransferase involved in cell wall biosynthesis